MHKSLPIFALLFAITAANATNILAVLEIVPKSEIDVSITEIRHLTDELRKQAVSTLPNEGYTVLTRDNMIALIPSDEAEAKCLAESCAVEIGRAIGVEYISQGAIGYFGDELSLSIELYETMSGKLLGSIVMESRDIKGLLTTIREQAPGLFANIAKKSEQGKIKIDPVETAKLEPAAARAEPVNVNVNVEVKTETKSKISNFLAVTFDVLGAAGLGFGIYKHIDATIQYDKYKKMGNGTHYAYEYEEEYQKVKDAQKLRNISLIAGGALLFSGISIHIFF